MKALSLAFKSYGQCKSFCRQTGRPKTICPKSVDAGHKKYVRKKRVRSVFVRIKIIVRKENMMVPSIFFIFLDSVNA